jgi:hypothetical protein
MLLLDAAGNFGLAGLTKPGAVLAANTGIQASAFSGQLVVSAGLQGP